MTNQIHHDFGDAACRQTAHEARPADVDIVDLEPESRRQQHAKRRDDAQQLAFAIRRLDLDIGDRRCALAAAHGVLAIVRDLETGAQRAQAMHQRRQWAVAFAGKFRRFSIAQ